MHRHVSLTFALALVGATLTAPRTQPAAQSNGALVFVSRRPPRELHGNIRAWANAAHVNSYPEDTSAHVWRVQFMAFLARPAHTREVTLVFYKIEGRTRRYLSNESVSLSSPDDAIFYHQTVLHRGADEFQPMENYEAAITVSDARGQHEIARGRIGLVGVVERHSGVVDFTGANGPVIR
ncbi:MAG: hypothetical protein U0326_42390 [Polyangiales bacterium]